MTEYKSFARQKIYSLKKSPFYGALMHKKYSEDDSYYYYRFEDLLKYPRKETKKLCKFLGIKFHEDMLNVKVIGSSYDTANERGFNKKAIDTWKTKLDRRLKNLLDLFLSKEIETMGYSTK